MEQQQLWLLGLLVLVVLWIAYQRSFPTRESFQQLTIPQKIWQTYKSQPLPKRALECQQSWKSQPGYTYHFHDDNQMRSFIRREMPPRVFKVFESLPLGVMKADLWRYCVLYVEGGIYADIDASALKPVSAWKILPEHKFIFGLENDMHFCQWTFASVPGHPILKAVIDLVVEECEKGIDTSNEHFVHQHTGPGIWTRAIHYVLEYPKEQKARHTYNLYRTQPEHRQRFERLGMRIEDRPYFFSEMVRNLYGSTQFSDDGYISWTKERDQLMHQSVESSSTTVL